MEHDNNQFEEKLKKIPLRNISRRLMANISKELDKGKAVIHKAAQKNIWPRLFAEASVALMVLAIGLSLWTYMHSMHSKKISQPETKKAEQLQIRTHPKTDNMKSSLPENGVLQVERVWEQCNDRGTFMLDSETPVRTFERVFVKEIEWRNPQTNVTLQMEIPKRDIILVTMPVH